MMNAEIKALQSELSILKLQFSERVAAVEARLNLLLAQDSSKVDISTAVISEEPTSFENSPLILNSSGLPQENHNSKVPTNQVEETLEYSKVKPTKPSFISLIFHVLFNAFFDWFSPVVDIYQSYKNRGMLGVFILTVAGIALTLAGFGYLMQLLVDQLGAGAKSLLMSVFAVLVIAVGIGLKIKTRFGEFASAIVTLGILLAYSTVYFSGSVYGILPNIAVLTLYLLIAISCHGLAAWLDTKVVASLGIIGIAAMPILSNTVQVEPLYYLLSLAFVVASSLIFAYRKAETWLANLSLVFVVIALEWIVAIEGVAISSWLVNLFYLLFFAYVVMALFSKESNGQDKEELSKYSNINNTDKKTLVFLSALVGSVVLFFFQASYLFSAQMSFCFAFNSLVATGIGIYVYQLRHQLTHFVILLSMLWAVLAVVSAFSAAYWGIAWAVEGLLLFAVGRRYAIKNVIHQGQFLSAFALVYCLSALAPYFPLPALKTVDGWLLSLVISAVLGIWLRLINNDTFDVFTTKKVKPFLQLLEVIWLSILFIACADIWLGNWTGACVILLQIAILFRAKQCKQVSIEIFAATLILVALFYAYKGSLLAGSFRFTQLPLFAKLSLVSAFSQLWLWSAFYRKYQPESPMKALAESIRILFFMLLPICWLGSVIRRFDENALMILWLSPALAVYLAQKIKHKFLAIEAQILTGLSSVSLIVVVGELTLLNGFISLLGFSCLFLGAFLLHRKGAHFLYQFICTCGVLVLGFAIPSFVGFQTDNILYGLLTAAILWALAFNKLNASEHLKRNELFITITNLALVVIGWILMAFDASYVCIPVIFLAAAIYNKPLQSINSRLNNLFKLNGDLLLHSIAAITYVVLFAELTIYRLELLIAPTLAIHGALILFLKDRRITTVKYSFVLIMLGIGKLAMVDAANALLWQKVILFMGIGLFILAATFWYQKIISKTEINHA